MIRLKFLLPALVLALPAVVAKADPCAPLTNASYGQAAAGTNCNTLITISANGTATITYPNTNPYDGSDDNYVGVINNSSSAITSINLSSTANIFGFDEDGIDEYGITPNGMDLSNQGASSSFPYGYGGPNAYFTNLNCTFDGYGDCNGAGTTGTVDFITPIAANGGTAYFSLEEAPDAADQTGVTGTGTAPSGPSTGVTPEPGSLALFGTGALGLVGAARRRIRR